MKILSDLFKKGQEFAKQVHIADPNMRAFTSKENPYKESLKGQELQDRISPVLHQRLLPSHGFYASE